MGYFKNLAIESYIKKLERTENKAEELIIKAVYAGAGVAADATRTAIAEVYVTDRAWGTERRPLNGARGWEREALSQGLGLSSIKNESGYINTKLGFDGYYWLGDKRIPIPMVARSIESGTSFMRPQKIVKKAIAGCKAKVVSEMEKTLDEEINKIMK